jgi:sRNA-binding regulator protein Hfq
MKIYDPYVSLVHKRVKISLVTGEKISGKLLQTANYTIFLQGKKSRMVVQKNHILYVREIIEPKKDDSSENHLRRSK